MSAAAVAPISVKIRSVAFGRDVPISPKEVRTMHPVLTGGIAVGILDILAAFVVRYGFGRVPPIRVLQGIASGVLGPSAFSGGVRTAVAGLALHFVIAFGVAAVYFAASRSWQFLVRHPVWSGIAYGWPFTR
jgi:hypothetical protein